MADEGSIHSTVVEYSNDGFNGDHIDEDTPLRKHIWPEDIQDLVEQSRTLQPDFGQSAMRESIEVDLSGFYRST